MKRYMIERNIPGVGGLNGAQLKDASATSNTALSKLGVPTSRDLDVLNARIDALAKSLGKAPPTVKAAPAKAAAKPAAKKPAAKPVAKKAAAKPAVKPAAKKAVAKPAAKPAAKKPAAKARAPFPKAAPRVADNAPAADSAASAA